jgi:hypothetical protein
MTDIVERLRETEIDCYTPPEVARECREAADEIERLRGFASWILDAYDSDEWPAQKDIVAGAREALGDD